MAEFQHGLPATVPRPMLSFLSDAGLSCEGPYEALSGKRMPTLGTVLRVVAALDTGAGVPGAAEHR